MKRHKNFIFHGVLWVFIWATAWLFNGGELDFMRENWLSLIFQLFAIALLIYFAIPHLLLKKKYLLFSIALVVTVIVVTLLLTQFTQVPNIGPGFGPGPGPGPGPGLSRNADSRPPLNAIRRPPSKFFINLLLISIACVVATLVEIFLFAQRKEEEIIKNRNENLQTELKFLKSQINPHFLFNSLNNIYALSAIDAGKTQESISYLSDMLRYVLYECEQEIVPLYKEMDYIKNYLQLFSLKSSKSYPITTQFHAEDAQVPIAPMLLIPFLENALKHSNIEKITGTFIRISLTADKNQVNFEIENSKPNSPLVTDGVGGIGIDNVKKRLAILYPNRHLLKIEDTPESFKVNLKLQLNA
ncbi:sensor histidine kinase [Maribacter sp. LLG6340-A2]|uniref:sensor histidine kinase n=1 Tax=Maribacter sp. LLG6340-A2 TaxID=3160834 RepID=UPI00386C7A83